MAKRTTILPKAPMARILVNAGAKRVSTEAMEAMVEALERVGLEISEQAIKNAKHAGRKTVHDSDVKLAVKQR